MTWSDADLWMVVTASLAGLACALPGSFLLLRKMSMMGDAISHAVLPGIAIAFWATQSRAPMAMVIGATIAGIVTAVLTQTLNRVGAVEEGASMGVVFTVMFAVGLVLLERVAHQVDLDMDCVLYGVLALVPIADLVTIGVVQVPEPVLRLAVLVAVNLAVVLLLYKEWKLSSFDGQLSSALGFPSWIMHYLLMIVTSVTTVFCFEVVGSILVIAMLIVPAATARLLTDRFGAMLTWACVLVVLFAAGGHIGAQTIPDFWGYRDTSSSGGIAVVSGLGFVLAVLFAPRHGVVRRGLHQRALWMRTLEEDFLGWLYRETEQTDGGQVLETWIASRRTPGVKDRQGRRVLRQLQGKGWVRIQGQQLFLTERGAAEGAKLIRSHRLWESWLHEHTALAMDHLHLPAEQLEHVTDAELRTRLSRELSQEEIDPMGRSIPKPDGWREA